MGRIVELTWRFNDHGTIKTFVEKCYLLSEEDTFYTLGKDDEEMPVIRDLFDEMAKLGKVLFEDRTGVFGLNPGQIVSIKEVE